MAASVFPDPRKSTREGIVALGEDLSAETLLDAYRNGIFPWPIEGLPLPWFCPPRRGILEFKDLHVPRSLEKVRKKLPFRLTIDRAFDQVIEACAETPRPGEHGTWITPEILRAYGDLHHAGHAHSVEAWAGLGASEILVGGVYGVDSGGAFAAESMFFRKPHASKLALLHLIAHLKEKGLDWLDIQMVTPHMEVMGAREISRDVFLRRLSATRAQGLRLFP